jgi:hypothetical protein
MMMVMMTAMWDMNVKGGLSREGISGRRRGKEKIWRGEEDQSISCKSM